MNNEEIRLLLNRFYLGETTIDEERRLISLLLSDDCPDDLKVERHAVISLARDEAIPMPGGMEQRITAAIQTDAPGKRCRWWIGIAASLLFIIGIAYWASFPKAGQPTKPEPKPLAETSKPAQPVKEEPEPIAQTPQAPPQRTEQRETPARPLVACYRRDARSLLGWSSRDGQRRSQRTSRRAAKPQRPAKDNPDESAELPKIEETDIQVINPTSEFPVSFPLTSRRDDLCRRIDESFPQTIN